MHKAIFIILAIPFVIGSNDAIADWIKISEYNDISHFVDLTTARKDGNIVKMWTMFDSEKTIKTKYDEFMSMKTLYEFDCKEMQLRSIDSTSYSENMGRGKVVLNNPNPGKWRYISPESAGHRYWRVVCER